MIRFVFGMLTVVFAQAVSAEPLEYKSWKVFESDYGYEFKHPDCWEFQHNAPGGEGLFDKAADILIYEKSCKTKQRDPYVPNGVSFSASTKKYDEAERAKQFSSFEKGVSGSLKNQEYLVSEKRDVEGNGKIVVFVEHFDKYANKIRWEAQLFCPRRVIYISGASTKDPDKSLLEKFKKGDLALPEPYKTIYDSVKCTRDRK